MIAEFSERTCPKCNHGDTETQSYTRRTPPSAAARFEERREHKREGSRLLAFPAFFETRVSAGDAGRRATRWDLLRARRIWWPDSGILTRFVSASFAVSAVKRDLDRSVIRNSLYQANRRPNCAARPSSAVVMTPAVAFEIFASGLPKLL